MVHWKNTECFSWQEKAFRFTSPFVEPVTNGFPSQRAANVDNISMARRGLYMHLRYIQEELFSSSPWVHVWESNEKRQLLLSPPAAVVSLYSAGTPISALNVLQPGQNGQKFADNILQIILLSANWSVWIKFEWSLFLSFQLMITQHWENPN